MSMQDLAFPATAEQKLAALRSKPTREGVIFAIDPGTTESGWCLYDGSVIDSGTDSNHDLLRWVRKSDAATLAIEMVASYGMAVGKDVFETVRWIGRFQQAWRSPDDAILVYRREVKLYLCNSMQAKDANVRQALIDRFPPSGAGKRPQIGTKAKPGPLYGISGHAWSALAVAVTTHHQIKTQGA